MLGNPQSKRCRIKKGDTRKKRRCFSPKRRREKVRGGDKERKRIGMQMTLSPTRGAFSRPGNPGIQKLKNRGAEPEASRCPEIQPAGVVGSFEEANARRR